MRAKFSSEQLEGREQGKPIRRWEDNIKMDVKELVYDCVNWIQLA
jgi:hypothetical protein